MFMTFQQIVVSPQAQREGLSKPSTYYIRAFQLIISIYFTFFRIAKIFSP